MTLSIDERKSGIVVPLGSLRTARSGGVGEYPDLAALGEVCSRAGLSFIQLLPVNDTGFQSSPYSALSAFALHPLYLRIGDVPEAASFLPEAAALAARFGAKGRFPYPEVLAAKLDLLRRVFEASLPSIRKDAGLSAWMEANPWVREYAVFLGLKEENGGKSWKDWPGKARSLARRDRGPLGRSLPPGRPSLPRLGAMALRGAVPLGLPGPGRSGDSPEGGPPHPHERRFRGRVGPPLLVPHGPHSRGSAGHVLRARAELGLPRLRLGRPGPGGVFLLDGPAAPGGQVLRRLPDRPCAGLLPDLGPAGEGGVRVPGRLRSERAHYPGRPRCRGLYRRPPPLDLGTPRARGGPGRGGGRDRRGRPRGAGKAASAVLDRIGSEPLFLFKGSVRGEKDLRAADLPEAARDFLLSAWRDRVLLPRGPDEFTPAWRYYAASHWFGLSDAERSSLEGLIRSRAAQSEKVWEEHGRRLLSALKAATSMLPCAEDLGAVPPCVPRVLEELGILGLRIPRWTRRWGEPGDPYVEPADYPRLTVCAPSVHDTSTLRDWWENETAPADREAAYGGSPAPEAWSPEVASPRPCEGRRRILGPGRVPAPGSPGPVRRPGLRRFPRGPRERARYDGPDQLDLAHAGQSGGSGLRRGMGFAGRAGGLSRFREEVSS